MRLNLDVTDRRRLAVATAFTVVALPAIWLSTRSDASTPASPAPVATDERGGADQPAMGTASPIFIDGPSTSSKPAVIQIVIPAAVEGDYTEGAATYKTDAGGAPDSCGAPDAPFGATLTVTNRDNGRSIVCVNRTAAPLATGLAIQLNAVQFAMLGRLIDAPLPVRITWNGSA